MLSLYNDYYRLHGIKNQFGLVSPKINKLEELNLTKNSLLHFYNDETNENLYGIPYNDFILRNVDRTIFSEHIVQLKSSKGHPLTTKLSPLTLINDYHKKNKTIRKLTNFNIVNKDSSIVLIENYCLLNHLYRYQNSFLKNYFEWWNIQSTIWNRVSELNKVTNRQQFIIAKVPNSLPTLADFKKADNVEINRQLLNIFNTSESLFILEIWKWLGENRNKSVLSIDNIEPESLNTFNLILTYRSKWVMINFGLLDDFRERTKTETPHLKNSKRLKPKDLQNRFLHMLISLTEHDDSSEEITFDEEAIELNDEEEIQINEAINDRLEVISQTNIDNKTEKKDNVDSEENDELEISDEEDFPIISEKDFSSSSLEKDIPLENAILEKAKILLNQNSISNAEFERLQKLSTAFKSLPDPYGKYNSLVEQSVINEKDLLIDKEKKFKDSVSIIDKSMLKSSVSQIDKKYIENILQKDLSNMILNVHKAGIAVTSYEIKSVESAMENYDEHIVQLTPISGKQSTVRFRYPKIKKDGTFVAGGVNYRLCKQRGDLPIRKLTPSKVALTSYYGKVFINRSEKQVHNYSGWLTNNIAEMGMDQTNGKIKNLSVGDVFDQSIHVPRVYSLISKRFKSFSIDNYNFFFDFHQRENFFGKENIEKYEEKNLILVGKDNDSFLIIDNEGMIFKTQNSKLEPIGNFESLLNIDTKKIPIEIAEIRILGKNVPLGILLSYHFGFENLIKFLKLKPRIVPVGGRLNLNNDEYSIKFKDSIYIFEKTDIKSTLIMGGISVFNDLLSNYSVGLFNKKDIYFNILEQKKLGVRYIREMDLMIDLFVDPITKEILEKIKEPNYFIGLLFRSCELLTTEWSPMETDMKYMRIKGYERLPGIAYGSLVRSIRLHRSKGSSSKSAIEINPLETWLALIQDPSVKLVEESNPVHNVKEREEVTYSGIGGRTERSMVAKTRVFHQNDLGVISEATKDSSAVAVTTYLTPNADFENVRGLISGQKLEKLGSSSLISTSALLSPAADRDD